MDVQSRVALVSIQCLGPRHVVQAAITPQVAFQMHDGLLILCCSCPWLCSCVQCGFVAQAPNPLQFNRFQPVLELQGGACTPQPLSVRPFFGGGLASATASANAFANAAAAKAFADACAQAFGGG